MSVDWITRATTEDQVLFGIVLASAAFLLVSFALAMLTIAIRLSAMRKQALRAGLERAWQALLLSALAGDADAPTVRRAVAPSHELFFVEYVLRFIDRVTGNDRRVLREIARPYLPRVAAQLRERRAEARARAVQTLVRLGMDEYDREVVAALDDESLTVAMVAARALASPEHTRFAEDVLRRIHRFEHWNRHYLVSLFVAMGSDVAPALRGVYADVRAEPVVRKVAAEALLDLEDLASVELAHAVAQDADDPELVAVSLRLLGRVGGPAHADVSRRALSDPDPLLRLRAAEALAELGGADDLLRLRVAMDDASPWVALAAARGLARGPGRELLESIGGEQTARGTLAREVLHAGARPV